MLFQAQYSECDGLVEFQSATDLVQAIQDCYERSDGNVDLYMVNPRIVPYKNNQYKALLSNQPIFDLAFDPPTGLWVAFGQSWEHPAFAIEYWDETK